MKKIEDKCQVKQIELECRRRRGGKRLRKKTKNPEVKARRGGDGASSRKGSREICKRIVGGWDWISDFSGGGAAVRLFFSLGRRWGKGTTRRGLTFGASVAGLCAEKGELYLWNSGGNGKVPISGSAATMANHRGQRQQQKGWSGRRAGDRGRRIEKHCGLTV
ncbi:hypothetical protein BGX38DRAFT_795093 [Terfezia claveryi]|nr:hypothetical protein BGX38DRAFT_795093 [Terfezia claveryi]